MSNKTGKLIFLKSNRKDTGLMNRNMKERISAQYLKKKIQ